MHRITVIAGKKSRCFFEHGERNRDRLRDEGVCLDFEFDTLPELQAFMQGFEMGSKLKKAILTDEID